MVVPILVPKIPVSQYVNPVPLLLFEDLSQALCLSNGGRGDGFAALTHRRLGGFID